MTISYLSNYLRSQRKRLALSQDEVAFLLGTQSGAKVCRDERFTRTPSLESALAYEIIFRKPARELFKGLYQKIERKVADRAKVLAAKIECLKPTRQTARKLKAMADLSDNVLNLS